MIFDLCYTIANEFLKMIGFIVSRRAMYRECEQTPNFVKNCTVYRSTKCANWSSF